MTKFTIVISIVILIVSLVLLFDGLYNPRPIQITLESGQEITTSTPEYFSFSDVMVLVISAFLIGTAATFLFYNSDRVKTTKQNADTQNSNKSELNKSEQTEKSAAVFDSILPLLKPDEKKVIAALRENNGEMQQNKLVTKLGVSKVKATRILYSLEQKKLITKERYGLTNNIKLDKKIM